MQFLKKNYEKILLAVVVVAALVNRFRPAQRPRLRRQVTVFALFATATLAGIGFHTAGLTSLADGTLLAARTDPNDHFEPDAPVTMTIAPGEAHFFSAEDGRRLAP